MLFRYKGSRYRAAANPDLVEYVEADELHSLDYDDAQDFYAVVADTATDADLAYLGCVDRFFLFTAILGRHDGFHPWLYDRCREVELEPDGFLDLWAREHFKAVDIEEPILTPIGWRKHGDLEPGDQVFGADGKPADVVARTRVFTNADCYRVNFSDGYSLVVSGDHLWTVNLQDKSRVNGANVRKKWKRVTINTRELMAEVERSTGTSTRRYPTIDVAAAVEFPTKDLPIDPYVLGAWLGDGTTTSAAFTASKADFPHFKREFEAAGHTVAIAYERTGCYGYRLDVRDTRRVCIRGHDKDAVGVYRRQCAACRTENERTRNFGEPRTPRVLSLAERMRQNGMLRSGHKIAKFIPDIYKDASIDQRMALLQGLMDTDGSCAKSCGQATFANTNERLAMEVLDLAQSLGMKATIRKNCGKFEGRDYYSWQVQFLGRASNPPFRLDRKIAACVVGKDEGSRRVMKVELVESQPVSCIQVDREDGLYLVGRNLIPTHNSSLITNAGSVQEILNDPEITIGVFSHTKSIAEKFVAQVKREFEANARLRRLYPDVCWLKPGSEAPVWSTKEFTVRRKTNPKEATMEAHGLVDGQPTSRHFGLLLYDDVVTRESVTTSEQIKKTTEAWELSDNLGSGDRRKWMIGTRYHFGDTYGDIIQRGVVTERKYAATSDGTINGKPVLLSQVEWDKKKKTQLSTLAAQMLQNPLSGKERTFEPTWFKRWEVRPATVNVYIMADPSRGRTATSDRTAIPVVAIDAKGNKYLVDGFCHRMTLSQRWDNLKHLHKKWSGVPGVGILKVGYERFGQQSDDEYFKERMQTEGYFFSIEELSWPREGGASKQHRVERLQPDFQHGTFYLPAFVHVQGRGECQWSVDTDMQTMRYTPLVSDTAIVKRMKERGQGYLAAAPIKRKNENGEVYDVTRELIDEMTFFPFAQHDDLVDATSRIYDMEPMAASVIEELPDEIIPEDA